MDKGAHIVTGPLSPEYLTGRSIILNDNIEYGKTYITNQYLITRSTNDLVWDTIWKRTVLSEHVKAHRFLRNLAITTRIDLGLSTSAFPLPFDDYEYNLD